MQGPQKRTFGSAKHMSAKGQRRTSSVSSSSRCRLGSVTRLALDPICDRLSAPPTDHCARRVRSHPGADRCRLEWGHQIAGAFGIPPTIWCDCVMSALPPKTVISVRDFASDTTSSPQQLSPAHQALRVYGRVDSAPTLERVRLLCATLVFGSEGSATEPFGSWWRGT